MTAMTSFTGGRAVLARTVLRMLAVAAAAVAAYLLFSLLDRPADAAQRGVLPPLGGGTVTDAATAAVDLLPASLGNPAAATGQRPLPRTTHRQHADATPHPQQANTAHRQPTRAGRAPSAAPSHRHRPATTGHRALIPSPTTPATPRTPAADDLPPVVSPVASALTPVAPVVAPAIVVLPPITDALTPITAPVLTPVASALAPVVTPIADALTPVVAPVLTPVTSALAPVVGVLAPQDGGWLPPDTLVPSVAPVSPVLPAGTAHPGLVVRPNVASLPSGDSPAASSQAVGPATTRTSGRANRCPNSGTQGRVPAGTGLTGDSRPVPPGGPATPQPDGTGGPASGRTSGSGGSGDGPGHVVSDRSAWQPVLATGRVDRAADSTADGLTVGVSPLPG